MHIKIVSHNLAALKFRIFNHFILLPIVQVETYIMTKIDQHQIFMI